MDKNPVFWEAEMDLDDHKKIVNQAGTLRELMEIFSH